MPKDSRPKKGKDIEKGNRRDRIKESSDNSSGHIKHSDRLPYRNTIKHDTEPSKNSDSFKKK